MIEWCQGKKLLKSGKQSLLTEHEEKKLVTFIKQLANVNMTPTHQELRLEIANMLRRDERKLRLDDGMPCKSKKLFWLKRCSRLLEISKFFQQNCTPIQNALKYNSAEIVRKYLQNDNTYLTNFYFCSCLLF